MGYAEVHVSCEGDAEARRIGSTLVEERLAACAQWFGIGSVYRWQGDVDTAHEVLLVVKTTDAQVDAVATRIAALHSYELPAITWTAGHATAATLTWIEDATTS
jgi:periplasmic divalent cation tolerance protein